MSLGDAVGASAGTSLLGGIVGASSANKAASIQARQAADSARSLGQAGEVAQGYFNPYVAGGTSLYQSMLADPTFSNVSTNYIDNAYDSTTQASNENNNALGTLSQGRGVLTNLANGGITADTIQNLPGYQATLALGQQGVTNSAAARGLANSGAALKGAAGYATTMAQDGYQNLFQDQMGTANALAQNADVGLQGASNQLGVANNFLGVNSGLQGNVTNAFNRQNALAQTGFSASQDSAQNALAAAGSSNAYAGTGANALASGVLGGANALTGGLGNAAGTAGQYAFYQRLLGGNNYSGGNSTIDGYDPSLYGTVNTSASSPWANALLGGG